MALLEINTDPSRRQLRQFAGIWFPGLFAVIGGWVLWYTGSPVAALAVWLPAVLLSVVGFFVPRLMRWIFVGWMVAAWPVGWLISHLLLAGVYYLLFTPIGVMMRVAGRDPLGRRLDRSAETYWVARSAADDRSRYFRQF